MSDRIYVRQSLLASPRFAVAVEHVVRELEKRQLAFALIGGIAVAHYANPPQTLDVDFLVRMNRQQAMHLLQQVLKQVGWEGHPIRLGKRPCNPQMGIFFFPPVEHLRVDLLTTSNDPFLERVVDQAVMQEVNDEGLVLPVATPEDLIVLKTLAGRDKDIEDITHVYRALHGKLDQEYIERSLDECGMEYPE